MARQIDSNRCRDKLGDKVFWDGFGVGDLHVHLFNRDKKGNLKFQKSVLVEVKTHLRGKGWKITGRESQKYANQKKVGKCFEAKNDFLEVKFLRIELPFDSFEYAFDE